MPSDLRAFILRPGEGRTIDLGNFLTDIADRYGMEVIGPVPEGYL
jgi:hypothetical protein